MLSDNNIQIKGITTETDLAAGVQVIRNSFATVAREFQLNEANCPTNPAFITIERLRDLKDKGVRLFGLYRANLLAGFVAIEKAGESLFYMEKLAVLPDFRHRGFGKQLMDFVFEYVTADKGKKVSIGIVNENTRLKNWYQEYGFVETGIKKYEHLPFTVCFMEKEI